MNPDNIFLYFFYGLLVFLILVMSYGEYKYGKVKEGIVSNTNQKKRFWLRWLSMPLIIYSTVMIILNYFTNLASYPILMTHLISGVLFLIVVFPFVPILLKYGGIKGFKDFYRDMVKK